MSTPGGRQGVRSAELRDFLEGQAGPFVRWDSDNTLTAFALMAALDHFAVRAVGRDPCWPEEGPAEEAIELLAAPENRAGLREWYSRIGAIAPVSERVRQVLRKMTGEDLPLGGT